MILAVALGLAGCQSIVGPFQSRPPKRVDDPLLPISEQQRNGRDRLAIVEDQNALAPKAYIDRPGTNGR
jgi:hypothetical protein